MSKISIRLPLIKLGLTGMVPVPVLLRFITYATVVTRRTGTGTVTSKHSSSLGVDSLLDVRRLNGYIQHM